MSDIDQLKRSQVNVERGSSMTNSLHRHLIYVNIIVWNMDDGRSTSVKYRPKHRGSRALLKISRKPFSIILRHRIPLCASKHDFSELTDLGIKFGNGGHRDKSTNLLFCCFCGIRIF